MLRPSAVSSAREDSCEASASSSSLNAVDGQELARLPVAERDGACFVQQEHVDVTSGLDGAPAHRKHVCLIQAAHARNADRGEQRADGRRRKANEQGNHIGNGHRRTCARLLAGKSGERKQRAGNYEEDDRQCDEQNLQRDFIRRFPYGKRPRPSRSFIEEALAAFRCYADDEPIGEYACATRHRAAIAAGFADHGCGFACDGALIHGCRAVDDLAVHRDLFARLHIDDVAFLQVGGQSPAV